MTDLDRNKYKDLLEVGAEKACGYLPLSTIEMYGGEQAQAQLIFWAMMHRRESKVIKGGTTGSGALYVWHYDTLKAILKKYRNTLNKASVPTEPQQYIEYIEHHPVLYEKFPLAYIVIGLTFADSRFNPELSLKENHRIYDVWYNERFLNKNR